MDRRQIPRQWLVADERTGDLQRQLRTLPKGSGVLFLYRDRPAAERARLLRQVRRVARLRSLVVADEAAREAARIHSMRELRRAALVPVLFLSPINRTRSHAGWTPLPKMRAATLVRLAKAPVVALGGMDERRFSRVQQLGFRGWAGIDAWVSRGRP